MVAAVRETGWAHYPCFAHSLNLVVKKTVPDLPEIQRKSSAIVSISSQHYSYSTSKLKEIQKQQNFPEQKLLPLVETRWNFIFYMERLPEQFYVYLEKAHFALVRKNGLLSVSPLMH